MLLEEKYINELKALFLKNGETAGDIEITHGNYDNNGNLIKKGILTITTDFCEIGSYDNAAYFVFIFYSNAYNKKLLDSLKRFSNVKIYGFKDFKTIFYPRSDFNHEDFENNIKKEKYFQAHFDYDFGAQTPELLYEEYLKIRDILIGSEVEIVNQLQINLAEES